MTKQSVVKETTNSSYGQMVENGQMIKWWSNGQMVKWWSNGGQTLGPACARTHRAGRREHLDHVTLSHRHVTRRVTVPSCPVIRHVILPTGTLSVTLTSRHVTLLSSHVTFHVTLPHSTLPVTSRFLTLLSRDLSVTSRYLTLPPCQQAWRVSPNRCKASNGRMVVKWSNGGGSTGVVGQPS